VPSASLSRWNGCSDSGSCSARNGQGKLHRRCRSSGRVKKLAFTCRSQCHCRLSRFRRHSGVPRSVAKTKASELAPKLSSKRILRALGQSVLPDCSASSSGCRSGLHRPFRAPVALCRWGFEGVDSLSSIRQPCLHSLAFFGLPHATYIWTIHTWALSRSRNLGTGIRSFRSTIPR
jgi:hypothetical protein